MKNVKFYVCPHCGNLVEMVNDAGAVELCLYVVGSILYLVIITILSDGTSGK